MEFNDPDKAPEQVAEVLEYILNNLKRAKTIKEKRKILKEFDMGFEIEKQQVDGTNLEDIEEYQKAKKLLYLFFDWLGNKRVDILKFYTERTFFSQIRNDRIFLIGRIIKELPKIHQGIQNYLFLNLYRSLYEINFKILMILAEEFDKVQGNPKPKRYDLNEFRRRFVDYESLPEVLAFFERDLRNPITHENWIVIEDRLKFENDKGKIKEVNMIKISEGIYNLFFFACVFLQYCIEKNRESLKTKKMTKQRIKKFEESIKEKIKEFRGKASPST